MLEKQTGKLGLCMYVCSRTHVCMHVQSCMGIFVCACACVSVHGYIQVCVCVCVCSSSCSPCMCLKGSRCLNWRLVLLWMENESKISCCAVECPDWGQCPDWGTYVFSVLKYVYSTCLQCAEVVLYVFSWAMNNLIAVRSVSQVSCVCWSCVLCTCVWQAVNQGVAITPARYLEKEEHLLPQPRCAVFHHYFQYCLAWFF